MTFKRLMPALFLVLCLALPSWAERLKVPAVEYSADSITETKDLTIKGKVFNGTGKQRNESSIKGTDQISIIRMDKKLFWMLMPKQKMYMEHAIEETSGSGADSSSLDIEQTVVGKEKVNGINTTKSKITATAQDGSKFVGFMWTTKEGIMVKMDATSNKGSNARIKTELKNLKIGKQAADLFEIPEGYSKMSGPGGFNVQEFMKQKSPKAKDKGETGKKKDSEETHEEKNKDDSTDGEKSPMDTLKGLFGR